MEEKVKTTPLEIKLKVSEDENKAYFEGYGAVFGNIDAYGDMIVKGAFKKTLEKWEQSGKKIPLLYQHHPSEILGVITRAYEDDYGLYIIGEINLNTSKGQEVYSLLKQGALQGLSIGYEVKQYETTKGIRKLLEVELWEISLVTFPANELAEVVKVKAVVPYQDLPLAPRDTPWDANKARQNIAKWASSDGSGDKDKVDFNKYKKAFLWYDAENPENFGSYKLPIADVINGTLKAVPRAIFAAGAVLEGARGGVNIPDADKDKIKRVLEKYYAKLDMTPPWKNISLQDEHDILFAKALLENKRNKSLPINSIEDLKQIKQIVDEILTAFEEIETKEQETKQVETEENKQDEILKKLDEILKRF